MRSAASFAVFCGNPIFTFQTELQRIAIFLITMRLHCQFFANKFQWIHIIFHIRKGASNIFRLQYYPLAGIILNREQRTIAHNIAAATGYNWSFAHKHHSVDRHLRTVIHPSAAGQSPCGGQHQRPGTELEKCSAVDHSNAPPVSGITQKTLFCGIRRSALQKCWSYNPVYKSPLRTRSRS